MCRNAYCHFYFTYSHELLDVASFSCTLTASSFEFSFNLRLYENIYWNYLPGSLAGMSTYAMLNGNLI